MKILNIGSLNFDKVYEVDRLVGRGETVLAAGVVTYCGGKGLNQSVALARAGAEVYHAGAVGADGEPLVGLLREAGVGVADICRAATATGHAIIQVSPSGENCIIVCAGANGILSEEYIDKVLEGFGQGDLLLLQNETSNVAAAMKKAKKRGMLIAFNASPINDALYHYPLELVDYYLVNEVEGLALSGQTDPSPQAILKALQGKYAAAIILTVGKEGVYYQKNDCQLHEPIFPVTVVDTTAAGDTFSGYFLASIAKGYLPAQALQYASHASALAVGKKGAAKSIPTWNEVEATFF